MYISDLHIHSRFSRATSKEGDPEHLELWARKKGIHLVGTGDFTHPQWREELKEKLEPEGNGLYRLKKEYRIRDAMTPDSIEPRFVVTGEISSIYKKNDKTRKVHNLLILPGLEAADRLSARLEEIGNIHSDGRPILGLDCRDLLENLLETVPEGIFVPAHIWTPHFAMFGAFSGFDTVEECFEDLTPHIHAVETGLSSDPPMNWRVSALDRFQLISNSDAHSPGKLGREANLMDTELSYEGLWKAIQTGEGLEGTIEFFPEEGKYHYDGHRKCHLCLSPAQTKEYQGRCPVCGRKLTIGVEHRVEELADRPQGFVRENAKAFESLMPLPELIAQATGHSAASAKTEKIYGEMLKSLGPEFEILRNVPVEDIQKKAGYFIGEGVRRLREGRVECHPGFDGEYGTIKLFRGSELEDTQGQISLFDGFGLEALSGTQTDQKGREAQLPIRPEQGKAGAEFSKDPLTGEKEKPLEPLPELNQKQQEAVESIHPVTAVIAGPGTGKTKTLIEKILYLIERRKVKPSQITAVTFTNKAAQEMRERLEKELGNKRALKQIQIGTFHSICLDILRAQGEVFSLADEIQVKELAQETIDTWNLKISVRDFLSEISLYKSAPGERAFPDQVWEDAFIHYQKLLQDRDLADFDDLLLKALDLAQSSQMEEECKKRFTYLLVDEFQDVNPVQYRLMLEWAKGGRELFVIGDPDQAIYGFRGSDSRCFERLKEDRPDTRKICLEENYRSVSTVVEAATAVISRNPGEERHLKAHRGQGEKLRIVEAASDLSEGIFVAKEINRLVGGIDMIDTETGFYGERPEGAYRSFSEIAVLCRTNRQLELLEKCLRKESIPYLVQGKEDFLSAELCAVPAFPARDIGFDRALIGAYGHDDRVCAYPALTAVVNENSRHTVLAMLVDKEEIGSEGNTGMQSKIYEDLMEDICAALGANFRKVRYASKCLSSDVTAAYDPNFSSVYEKMNSALLSCGTCMSKFTGARGKSGSNDASAEFVGEVRRMFDAQGVIWQTAELGKVDAGGGGTVAKFLANLNIDTVDLGVPVISMHAPYELISKADLYSNYRAFLELIT